MKNSCQLIKRIHGFSLVELSIVLVILGLLTGGILTGQSLIRAAELRAVTTEYEQWHTAVNTFQQKYFALPGDMANATDFWGSANGTSCPAGTTTTGSGTQTCNGNGDGYLNFNNSGSDRYYEIFMFWQHLANAGIINGNFSGKAASWGRDHSLIGTNVPASKFSNAGWGITDEMLPTSPANSNATAYGTDHKWVLVFGGYYEYSEPITPVLTPEEAWNIDTKIDDSIGSTGQIVFDTFAPSANCANAATPASYDLGFSSDACALIFIP